MNLTKIIGFSIGPIVSAAIGLISVPILTRIILPEVYGQFSIVLLTIQFLTLFFLLGLDSGFCREYYEEESKRKVVVHTLIPNIVLFFLVLPIIYYIGEELSFFIFGYNNIYILFYLMVSILMLIVIRYQQLIFRMEGSSFLYSLTIIIQAFVNFITIITCILQFNVEPIKALVISQMVSGIILLIFSFFYNINSGGIWIKNNIVLDMFFLIRLLKYSFPMFVSSIVMWFMYSSGQYLLSFLSSPKELGIYAAAYKLCAVLLVIQMIVVTFWTPLSLKFHKENKSVEIFQLCFDVAVLVTWLLFIFIFASRNILVEILSPEYIGAVKIITVLSLFPIFLILSEIGSVGLVIKRETTKILYISILCSAISFLTSWLLIPIFGALGAAGSLTISMLLYSMLRIKYSNIIWNRISLKVVYLFIASVLITLGGDIFFDSNMNFISISISIFAVFTYILIVLKRKSKNREVLCD